MFKEKGTVKMSLSYRGHLDDLEALLYILWVLLILVSGCTPEERLLSPSSQESVSSPSSSTSSVGNSTILCAKEHTYKDGTPPIYEWFLLGEPVSNKLYYSRSLTDRKYITTFSGDLQEYSFGVLPSGDIVACKRSEYLKKGGNDSNRTNPFVFKYSESWAIQHEVDFNKRLKPCGWARNGGFRPLPDGSVLMCEYTRTTVATANVWKIVGDPLEPENWLIKKSFMLSGDSDRGFKHCHAVMYDHFTGVSYVSTGDDNTGAMVFASRDDGDTWQLLREPSQKYCRLSMMTFTNDYVYWGQDSPGEHSFFRGRRVNGVLDYSTVESWVTIPGDKDHYFSTYGQAYLPEFNAVLLLERQDSSNPGQILPIRVIDLREGTIEIVGYVENTDPEGGYVGFRTIFSEWYPTGGRIHLGFGFGWPTYNKNKVCGNKWPINHGASSVNNLCICIKKEAGEWSLRFETVYL